MLECYVFPGKHIATGTDSARDTEFNSEFRIRNFGVRFADLFQKCGGLFRYLSKCTN